MNERIRELADRALAKVNALELPLTCREEIIQHGTVYNQLFAELIVKECANIARQTETDDSDDYKSGRIWSSLDILEHFGV